MSIPDPESYVNKEFVDSTSDERRVLSDDEKVKMVHLKDMGGAMLNAIRDCVPPGREASLAKTKIEEAVMWAVRGLTG
jgi:hypothetical protein